jgi:hypothetical protein
VVTALAVVHMWAASACAQTVYNPVNKHYYIVMNGPVTWDQANANASAMMFQGMKGYLATINTAQENRFLTDTYGGDTLNQHWLGGYQEPGSEEPGKGWKWVTNEPFQYANWFPPKEPNNLEGFEDRILFCHDVLGDGKCWNDEDRGVVAEGYVVEFSP